MLPQAPTRIQIVKHNNFVVKVSSILKTTGRLWLSITHDGEHSVLLGLYKRPHQEPEKTIQVLTGSFIIIIIFTIIEGSLYSINSP